MKNYSLLFLVVLLCNCKGKTEVKSSRVDALPYYNDASFTPHWLEGKTTDLKSFHKIPEFTLTNQDGQQITQKTFENKIYVTDFFFTSCPGICPKMTENMSVLQDAFKDDDQVLLLSHSVTPVKDSVSILKHYAEGKGVITNKWHIVTGDRKQIYDLGRQAYFVEEDLGNKKTDDDFLHTENFVLIDKNKHIRGIYNGLNKTAVQQLIADIKTLEMEDK
ncbi:SCO family protein [Olleya marilimosa]|uniref:SCO family protein n=1 Tax=Olleya marilimosa TaxID=272164 RepID=UPI0030EB3487|tara:strand:- start:84443 stop:85099 length:657 start_codon:yes stop_codon:yes gene_type:complete